MSNTFKVRQFEIKIKPLTTSILKKIEVDGFLCLGNYKTGKQNKTMQLHSSIEHIFWLLGDDSSKRRRMDDVQDILQKAKKMKITNEKPSSVGEGSSTQRPSCDDQFYKVLW